MATVGERDRARGSEVSRPRTRDQAKVYREREERKQQRKASGKPPRSEDATSIEEALEAEREAGRREGASSRQAGPKSPPAAKRTTRPASVKGPSPARARVASSPPLSNPGVTAPMVADILIITADELIEQHRAPIPSRLLVAFMVFGALGLAKGQAARPAKVFAWGIVVATFYSAAPGGKPPALNALAALGDFLGGKYGTDKSAFAPRSANNNGEEITGRGSFPADPTPAAGPIVFS